MKNLLCKWLPACLCMKPKSSPSQEPQLTSMRRLSTATDYRLDNKYENLNVSYLMETKENDPGNTVMKEIRDLQKLNCDLQQKMCDLQKEIRDLLKTRFPNEEQQPVEQEEQIKNDWMLAAAVLDRICAFAFTIIFVVGTTIFIALITTHRE